MRTAKIGIHLWLLTGLLILTLLPLSLIGFMAYQSGRQSILSNVKAHLESVASLKEQAIDDWSRHLHHTIAWFAKEPQVELSVLTCINPENSEDSIKTAYQYLMDEFQRLIKMGEVSQIYIVNADNGEIFISSEQTWEGHFRTIEPFFIQGKEKIFQSDIFLSLRLGRPTIVFSGPITDGQGNPTAVMVAHANFDRLSAIMLERSGLGNTMETFLVNKSNLLITNTVFAPEGAFKKWIFGEGAKWALMGRNGVDLFSDYRGVRVIGAYRWLSDHHLALIAKQDVSEAFKPIISLRNRIIVLLIGIFSLIIPLSLIFANTINTPLALLLQSTKMIGSGKLEYHKNTSLIKELESLSTAFYKMVKDLKNITVSRDELNQEVEERKKVEMELKSSLKEKEVLLREVHHRVKNNMQIVQSVLNLQSGKIDSLDFKHAIQDSNNRIRSMALIHETLYRSADFSNLRLDTYFKSIVQGLYRIYLEPDKTIEWNVEVDSVQLDMDKSIACGLIVNELVTNSFKYAFENKNRGEIKIRLSLRGPVKAQLHITDDGIGLPENVDINTVKSLGLQIVSLLSEEQLEGNLDLYNDKGLKVKIVFPV